MTERGRYLNRGWLRGLVGAVSLIWHAAVAAGYLSTGIVVNDHGECWNVRGGVPRPVAMCGDPPPEPTGSEAEIGILCPHSPPGYPVDAHGCPLDSDGDGVPDYRDECPDTEPGMAACSFGCEPLEVVEFNLVNDEFEFDRSVLKPDMKVALDAFARKLALRGDDEILHIVGHTDHIGTLSYNQALSERRASAVAYYLAGKGVSPRRMKLSGKGEAEPVADNKTAEGRARNRRVEVHFHAKVRRAASGSE